MKENGCKMEMEEVAKKVDRILSGIEKNSTRLEKKLKKR